MSVDFLSSRTTDIPATADLRLVRRLNRDEWWNSTDVNVRRTVPTHAAYDYQQAASALRLMKIANRFD